ncbi:MAG: 30S ribosome-binding factor RbfA [Bacteroidales bacterium]|nr:30S ribosome-binding factor RbfA [Bacteroidales bacterium]
MESTRQKKVAGLIQKEMSLIFQKTASDYMNKLISVTIVRVSPDLGSAKIYLSIFPADSKDAVFAEIKNNTRKLRGELGNIIRNQVRRIPELHFEIDDSLNYAEKIDELLKK